MQVLNTEDFQPRKGSHSSKPSKANTSTSSGKVVRTAFTPEVQLLADHAKMFVRTKVAMGDVFPPEVEADKQKWYWDVTEQVAKKYANNKEIVSAVRKISNDVDLKSDLLIYVRFSSSSCLSFNIVNSRYHMGEALF